MPQLSPLNWMMLFSFFWFLMSLNSSIMWWNTSNSYLAFNQKLEISKTKYNW